MSAEGRALVERLRRLAPEQRRAALEAAGEAHVKALDEAWPVWAHSGQIPRQGPGRSPDRADAMVWAMTELLLGPERAEPRVRAL